MVDATVAPELAIAHSGLQWIEKILTLQDRSPHSPTYGCFDRNYWQYRMLDFPCGMSQEFVYPLALAYSLDIPGSRWYQKDALREWAIAGMRFAATSAHPDGSCDDYFPFERAGGAAAFSLMASVESYTLLNVTDADEGNADILAGFEKRADWLANHHETGRLTNHQALIVHCLNRCREILGIDRWQDAAEQRLARVLEWQSSEGWFDEYGGFDPGYHSLTVALLANLWVNEGRDELEGPVTRAIEVMQNVPLPDGSPAGEIGSRNTLNYFSHGFEIVGGKLPQALALNDRFADAVANNLAPCYADDHIVAHHSWSYLLTWQNWQQNRPAAEPLPATDRQWLPKAGVLVDRREGQTLYVAVNKGGVYKHFNGAEQTRSDTQVSIVTDKGTAVSHLIDDYEISVEDDVISVSGGMGWAKQTRMSPVKMIILRCIMITGGRFFPNLIRSLLQKMLITGKNDAPFTFRREFRWQAADKQWQVSDSVTAENWSEVQKLGIDSAQTSISVIMSRVFQQGQLQGAEDFTDKVAGLKNGESLELRRIL